MIQTIWSTKCVQYTNDNDYTVNQMWAIYSTKCVQYTNDKGYNSQPNVFNTLMIKAK